MKTAKIFSNGKSQAVRLPKAFRFNTNEVYIKKDGDNVILMPKHGGWKEFFESPECVPDTFLSNRDDKLPQDRQPLV